MKFSYNGTRQIDLLFGYTVMVDRGIKFSASDNGEYGYVDRATNGTAATVTLQGSEDDIFALDAYIGSDNLIYFTFDAGEMPFGANIEYSTSGTQVNILSKSVVSRKSLGLYTIILSINPVESLVLKDGYDGQEDPTWDTIRYISGYTAGAELGIKPNALVDGNYSVSRSGKKEYATTFTCEFTNEEMATWRQSLIHGSNRISCEVSQSAMLMKLFGYNEYTVYKFYVKSFTEVNVSFDKWECSFTLVLRKKASE